MSESNAITTTEPKNKEVVAWELLQRQVKPFLESGFLPTHIKTLQQALTIAWKGRELGLQPMESFSHIAVVQGKPTLSSELMLRLIYERVPGARVVYTTPADKQHLEAEFEMARPKGMTQIFRFTLDDAKRAGLLNNTAWQKYPAAMLRARCISAGARVVFPDAIMGCYTHEEMGVDFEVEPSTTPPTESTTLASPPRQIASKMTDPPLVSEAQLKRLYAISSSAGWSHEDVKVYYQEHWGLVSSKELNRTQYDELCNYIQANPNVLEAP